MLQAPMMAIFFPKAMTKKISRSLKNSQTRPTVILSEAKNLDPSLRSG